MSGDETGRVYLVGAGPGDAGLLTERGRWCLAQADVVVYDRLVSPQLLTLPPARAQLVYVGKEANRHTVPQAGIEARLLAEAKQGRTVVRLKGGDPFVFGRGGEEALALTAAGVPFEVVPGVTSAIAVPAYAGIPVTHRQVATSFTVVTGHECVSADGAQVDWRRLADPSGTLVVLMGVGHIGDITAQLMAHGLLPDTPAAIVRWGGRAAQETLMGTVADIAERVERAGFLPPAVVVVGDVVKLRAEMAWLERKPLFGQRMFAVAETVDDARALAQQYAALGAETIEFALEPYAAVRTETVDAVLDAMILSASATPVGAWQFASKLCARAWAERLRARRIDLRRLPHVQFGAADPGVADTLARLGIIADWVGADTGPADAHRIADLVELVGVADRLNHVLAGWSNQPFRLVSASLRARQWVLDNVSDEHKAGLEAIAASADPVWTVGGAAGAVGLPTGAAR